MHSCVHNAVEQSDMTQACCVTTSETLIWWLTTISRPAFIFEAAWSTNFGISASPFISHHYCDLIAPLLLWFTTKTKQSADNVQAGQYTQTPTRSQGPGPSPQHRMGVSSQHQMQDSPQRQPQGRHQSRDRAGAIMRPQLTGQPSDHGDKKCLAA